MVERRDTHCHVDPCVRGEALCLEQVRNALNIFLRQLSLLGSSMVPGPGFSFADRTVWGSVRQTRSSGLDGFLLRPSETERERVKVSGART